MINKRAFPVGIAVLLACALIVYVRFMMSDMQMARSALRYYNDYDEAIRRLEKVVSKNPDNAEAHSLLCLAYGKSGDYKTALREFVRLREDHPGFQLSAKFHNEVGLFFYVIERYRDAIEEFKAATILKPNYVEAYFNLGTAYSALGDVKGALASYRTVIRLDPRHSYCHWNMAVNLEKQGDIEGAMMHWKKYMELTPGLFLSPEVRSHIDELEEKIKLTRESR